MAMLPFLFAALAACCPDSSERKIPSPLAGEEAKTCRYKVTA